MGNRKELGVFINPHADRKTYNAALRIAADAPYAFIDTIPPTDISKNSFPDRIVVAGGEGSIRTIIQEMYERECLHPKGGASIKLIIDIRFSFLLQCN